MITPEQLWALPAVQRTQADLRAAEQRFGLRPEQQRISWGSYAIRFFPMDAAEYVRDVAEPEDRVVLADPEDAPALKLIFVDIPTLGEFTDREQQLGADLTEALGVRDQAVRAFARGWRYGAHYSDLEPQSEPGMTHGSLLWPITAETFEWARAHGWKWQGNPDLDAAITAMIEQEVPVRVGILDRGFLMINLGGRDVLQLDVDIIRGAP